MEIANKIYVSTAKLVVFYFIRWVAFRRGQGNIFVFYYLSVSEIWPDKRGALWLEWL
jgi:hypothetical protein